MIQALVEELNLSFGIDLSMETFRIHNGSDRSYITFGKTNLELLIKELQEYADKMKYSQLPETDEL